MDDTVVLHEDGYIESEESPVISRCSWSHPHELTLNEVLYEYDWYGTCLHKGRCKVILVEVSCKGCDEAALVPFSVTRAISPPASSDDACCCARICQSHGKGLTTVTSSSYDEDEGLFRVEIKCVSHTIEAYLVPTSNKPQSSSSSGPSSQQLPPQVYRPWHAHALSHLFN